MAITPVSKGDYAQKPAPVKPKAKNLPPSLELKKPAKPAMDTVQISAEARAKAAQKKPQV